MRLQLLHYIAKVLRIQFKVDGLPYGSRYQERAESLSHSAQ